MSKYLFIFVHKITHLAAHHNITLILFHALKKYGQIGVRGLGVFRVVDFHQKLDDGGNLLLPPLKRVTFEEGWIDEENVATLSSEVVSQPNLNIDKLKKKIGAQFNRFLNYGIYDMKSFGQVKLMEDGKMIFEAGKSDELNKSARYLPAIELMPLEQSKIVAVTVEQNVKTASAVSSNDIPKVYKKEANGALLKTIGVLLLVAGLITLIYFWSDLFGSKSNHNVPDSEVIASMNTDSPDAVEEPVDKAYSSLLTPEILKSGCVIITGTFQNQQNANTSYKSIESKGYIPYIEEYNEMTRVGVVFDCRSEDLDNYLQIVQNDITPKAWFLRPDYKPKR